MKTNRRMIKGVLSESITSFIPLEMKEDLKAIGNDFAAAGLREFLSRFSKEIHTEAKHARKKFNRTAK